MCIVKYTTSSLRIGWVCRTNRSSGGFVVFELDTLCNFSDQKQQQFASRSTFRTYTMGAHFGELAKIRGIVYYKLSPYELKAFSGVLQNGIPNIFRRFRSSVFRVVPRKWLLTRYPAQPTNNPVTPSSIHLGLHGLWLGECRAPTIDPQESCRLRQWCLSQLMVTKCVVANKLYYLSNCIFLFMNVR